MANILGSEANETLLGSSGDDSIDGAGGHNRLKGGDGNDTYIVRNPFDVVIERPSQGYDTVELWQTTGYALAPQVEQLTLMTGVLQATGSWQANLILGNAEDNTIFAGSGDDTVFGGLGNDQLHSGDGNDDVHGEDGNDTLFGYTGDDTLNGDAGNDSLRGGIGNDILNGGDGDNTLFGGFGDDVMTGGAGNDLYHVNSSADVIFETDLLSVDAVESAVDFTLSANLENLVLHALAVNGIGNDHNNSIIGNTQGNLLTGGAGSDVLRGGDGDDTLAGGADNDQLYGGNGFDSLDGEDGNDILFGYGDNDTLNGGLGDDTLNGGAGNDVYIVDSVGDVVIEYSALATDIDTVQSSVDFSLHGISNIENLTLAGMDYIYGGGNELDNVIIGNSGNNTIQGDDGNDSLTGGNGADTLLGGAGNDLLYSDCGMDAIDGGIGNDTAVFAGGTSQFAFSLDLAGHWIVTDTATGGQSSLTDVEAMQFDDGTVSVSAPISTREFQVNTVTEGAQSAPDVVALSNGGYAIAWQSAPASGSYIALQTYDSAGDATGDEIMVGTASGSTLQLPRMASFADGSMVVTWVDNNPLEFDLMMQRIAPDGSLSGGPVLISTGEPGSQFGAPVTVLADDSFVVAWADWQPDGGRNSVMTQHFAHDGTPLSVSAPVSATFTHDSPDIAALADGSYIVVWREDESTGDLLARRYDAAGNPVTDEFAVTGLAGQYEPAVTATPDGGYVIGWTATAGNWDVNVREYDSNNALVSESTVAATPFNERMPQLATLANGRTAIAWEDPANGGQVRTQANATPTNGDYVVANVYDSDSQRTPAIAATTDGGYVVTWADSSQDGDSWGVFARKFDANGNPVTIPPGIVGDGGDNMLRSGAGTMKIDGGAGNDTLSGQADDIIVGGSGIDVLLVDDNTTFDLRGIAGKQVAGIETLGLGDHGSATVDFAGVIALSPDTDTLHVTDTTGGALMIGTGWASLGEDSVETGYYRYEQGTAVLLVQADILVS